MTEAEAKTKWCPFVRFSRDDMQPNRTEDAGDVTRCIASACMAWRFTNIANIPNRRARADEGIDLDGFIALNGRPDGYCGLAGAPA